MPGTVRILPFVLAACALLAYESWRRGEVVTAVFLELLPGAEEVKDFGLRGGGAPDYRLELEVDGAWRTVDAPANQPIGTGLELAVEPPVERTRLARLRLLERDRLGDDAVDEVELDGAPVEGTTVRFSVRTRRDGLLGLEHTIGTIHGLVAAFLVGFGVLLGVLRRMRIG